MSIETTDESTRQEQLGLPPDAKIIRTCSCLRRATGWGPANVRQGRIIHPDTHLPIKETGNLNFTCAADDGKNMPPVIGSHYAAPGWVTNLVIQTNGECPGSENCLPLKLADQSRSLTNIPEGESPQ